MEESMEALLDRAQTAREIAMLTALTLMASGGDGAQALVMLEEFEGVAPPEHLSELDAVTISQQAIRDAMGMRTS